MPELVVSGCQSRKPDEETRVAWAEADTLSHAGDPLLGLALEIKHRPEYGIGRREARIEPDRFLEIGSRATDVAQPH
jgi:hypothetical protein